MKLKSELYIAASQEAKELYQQTLPKDGFFNCEALTLSDILLKIDRDATLLDSLSARVYFKEVAISLFKKLKHFQFSKDRLFEDSIDLMFEFYIKVRLNSIELGEFFSGDKADDIALIFSEYEELKRRLNLYDGSDIVLNVNSDELIDFIDSYESVLVDWQFFEDGISFLNSFSLEKLFKSIIQDERLSQKLNTEPKQPQKECIDITLNRVFDFADEAKEGVKIAKKLISDGIDPSDIVVVASKLDDYKHHIVSALDEYNLRGYILNAKDFSTSAIYYELKSLKTQKEFEKYAKDASKKLSSIPQKLKKEYASYVNTGLSLAKKSFEMLGRLQLQNYKVSFEDIFTQLALNSTIEFGSRKDSVLITEHNQVLKKEFKHIIYIGIDATHLPQKFSENFLYSQSHSKLLHISNYYKDAVYVYERLKANSHHLYLVTAQYQNKRELQISSIIKDNFTKKLEAFDVSDVVSLNDLLDTQKQIVIDEKTKEYIISKELKAKNRYNGVLDIQEQKSIRFSASRLNEYRSCPLRYYFDYILKAVSPQEFDEDTFSSAESGTLFHAIVEEFANDFKYAREKNEELDVASHAFSLLDAHYQNALPKKDGKVYESVLHKQKKVELQVAIERFVRYVEDGKLDDFVKAEHKFDFVMDGNSFTGIIDRIDIDEANSKITLIDYKTSKSHKNSGRYDTKYEKLREFKEFQLPLYHFFIDQDDEYKKYEKSESYLLTFVGDMKDNYCVRFGQTSSTSQDEKKRVFLLNSEAKKRFRDEISKIADGINSGNFYYQPSEDACQYCPYFSMCGEGVRSESKF